MTDFKHWDSSDAAERYAAALDRLNMSHQSAARFFGVSKLTSMNWATGDARVPQAIGMLVELMFEYHLVPHHFYQRSRQPDKPKKTEQPLETIEELTAIIKAGLPK